MVTIAWNPMGFHLLDSLPKGRIFDAEYDRENILSALLPLRLWADGRKLMILADNASPSTSRKCTNFCAENAARFAAHPPYSPHLVPSDFFLFGYVKRCLDGTISR
jgi:hypothetical protein